MSIEQPYNKTGIIHKGYKYLYRCTVYNIRDWIRTDQYERWNCDFFDPVHKCRAYIIRDTWGVDEETIRDYGRHNHRPREEWKDYYGLMYDWEDDDDPHPKFELEEEDFNVKNLPTD